MQVFLGFANLYQQFIQNFSKITALFILMLKIIILLEKLIFKQLRVDNSEIDKFNNSNDEKISKKLRKLKNKKLFKSHKLAK